MFVGQGAIAFLVSILLFSLILDDKKTILFVSTIAGIFAFAPDVDILVGAGIYIHDLFAVQLGLDRSEFWSSANTVHRGITHSFISVPLMIPITYLIWKDYNILSAIYTIIATVSIYLVTNSILTTISSVLFIGVIILIFHKFNTESYRNRLIAMIVGLSVHPFTDMFTGEPPSLLYPFDIIKPDVVYLTSDLIYHYLLTSAIELIPIITAAFIYIKYSEINTVNISRLSYVLLGSISGLLPFIPMLNESFYRGFHSETMNVLTARPEFVIPTVLISIIIGLLSTRSMSDGSDRVVNLVLISSISIFISNIVFGTVYYLMT